MRPESPRLRRKADSGTRGQGENADAGTRRQGDAGQEYQLGLFASRDALLAKEIAAMDLNAMTPIEALTRLAELKKKASGGA